MLAAIVLVMLALAPLGLVARRAPQPPVGWGLALIPLAAFALFWSMSAEVVSGGQLVEVIPWAPAMGIDLAFRLDGLSLLFALLVSGIGTLIVLYTAYYMAGDPGMGRFYLALLLFMGAMLGLVLSDNILTLFVFWELTSVTSYLLVGYKHDYPESRRGAQMGLLITVGGGLALLVGMVLLGSVAGSYTISDIIAAGDTIKASPLYAPAVWLIFIGCFTKSAQFPFHFWLPNAMQAPTPASAFLHSATMVKAGVFLLARLHPALSGTPLWVLTLTAVGMITMLVGAAIAIRKDDIKGLLAYSTVSKLGSMVMLAGLGGPDAPQALMGGILAHALYKGALFMIAGIVDHETGTRSLSQLGGLRKAMPVTMALTVISALSMAGIPIFLGFVAKELLLKAAIASVLPEWFEYTVLAAIVASSILGVGYAWRLIAGIFLGPHGPGITRHAHDPAAGMLLGPGALTALSLILCLGLLPWLSGLLTPAATAMYGAKAKVDLSLWYGFNLALALSAVSIGAGAVLARFEAQWRRVPSPLPRWLSGDTIYDATISGMLDGATRFTRVVQGGKLRVYIAWSMLALVAAVAPWLLRYGLTGLSLPSLAGVTIYELAAALLIPVGVFATIFARTRLTAIIATGVVGAMVAFLFVIYSAPDLALTQLLIEVLSTVFMVLVFAVLPVRFRYFSQPAARIRDWVLAAAVGLMMAGVTYAAASSTSFPSIAETFRQESLPEGNGANVVNVIIVDFRGFDTMGEITVLFIALLGIYGMLRLRAQAKPSLAEPPPAPKPLIELEPEAEPKL